MNHSPSFVCDSELDTRVKTQAITDALSLIGVQQLDSDLCAQSDLQRARRRLTQNGGDDEDQADGVAASMSALCEYEDRNMVQQGNNKSTKESNDVGK